MKRLLSGFIAFVIMALSLCSAPVIADASTQPSGTYGIDYAKYGDVNLDTKINSTDALYALKYSVNKLTLTVNEKGPADVTLDGNVTADDALEILKYSVELIGGFEDETIVDKIGGGTDYALADAIPDKYQKKVTFKVANGTWSDGKTADVVTYKTLMSNGKYNASGNASLSAPTGMVRSYGYTGGAWNTTPPTSVSGAAEVVYTYSFSRMTVNYTVNHYRISTYSSYPSTPTATETKSGYVGDTVSATVKSYTGYSIDTSKSNTSQKLEEGSNTLNVYYNIANSNYITAYDKSNVANDAYVKDATADTSYCVNISTLKPFTVYKITEGASYTSNGALDKDYSRLIYAVQGLVNRDFGMDVNHTTMLYSNAHGETDDIWLDYIDSSDSILRKSSAADIGDGLTQVNITTWAQFYAAFKDVIKSCGIVLWDGNVPATANVAVTICSLDGYIPVLANSPLHNALVADGVPVKLNLVGMFKNGQKGTAITGTSVASTGSAKNDAYLWALEKYFNRCSSQYLAYAVDGAGTLKGYSAYSDSQVADLCETCGGWGAMKGTQVYNHDYYIARRMFVFDLYPYGGDAPNDDPSQSNGQASVGTDAATLRKILEKRYSRANGSFGQLIGFPPWWCKYASERGVGTKTAFYLEWLFTELITCYNLAKEADAATPTAMTNASAYYKYVPKKSSYTYNKTALESPTYNANTYYYTIYVGDYDSSAWLKNHMFGKWRDSKRGTLPLMWGINPNLSYRVPMAFDYMDEERTAYDYIVGGDGGAGYIIPEALFHDKSLAYLGEKRPSGNAAAGTLWANYSKLFYQRFGYEMTGFIINGAQGKVTVNMANSISAYSPKLNFTNCNETLLGKHGSTYFVHCYNQVLAGQEAQMYSHATSVKNNGYNFGAYRTVVMYPSEISTLVNNFNSYAASKGMTVKYVDPYTYYNLLQSSGQGTPISTKKTLITGFNSLTGVSTAFSTRSAIETNQKTEGTGALWLKFDNVTGQSSGTQIGGMGYVEFSTPLNLSSYTEVSFDFWSSYHIYGSAAIQINFVTNGKEDGYNFLIPIGGSSAGWHTKTIQLSNPSAVANSPNWSSIRAIRITYFNYNNNTTPDFLMFDNMQGISY